MRLFSRKRLGTIEDRSLTRAASWPEYPNVQIGDLSVPDALRLSDVFACIRCLSDTAASIPLLAYRRLPDGSRELFSGRVTDLINRPSPGNTSYNLVGTIVAHLNAWGNAYVGKYRDGDGVVVQLVPLDPSAVQPELVDGQPVYTFMDQTGVQKLGTSDLIHVKMLSTDGIVGISPIGQVRNAFGLAQNLAKHADSFAKNGGRPSGVLRVSGWRTAQPGAAEDVQADWSEKFVGADKSGKLLLLTGEGDIDYKQLSLSLEDAQFVAQRQLSTLEIARIFRVPVWMVNASTQQSMTYSNVTNETLSFQKFSLQPQLVAIEQAFSADSDLSPATVHCEFDIDRLLRADALTRAQVYTAALNPATGWLSRDEVRELEGYPPEGDPAQPAQATPSQLPTEPPPPGPPPISPNDPGVTTNA